jgi:hypothetical protein
MMKLNQLLQQMLMTNLLFISAKKMNQLQKDRRVNQQNQLLNQLNQLLNPILGLLS